jgi:hypothetical protein
VSRIRRLIGELGLGTALLYAVGLALNRWRGAALHDLLLYVQPVRDAPLLPPGRGASIEVRSYDGAAALAAGLPCPLEHAPGRLRSGMHCLAAYREGRLIGFHWINLEPHDDELVRARYVGAAWSFDLHIHPEHRGGLAFARLTDASRELLRTHGRRQLASYIAAWNRAAIAAEERLGGQRLGRALHLRLGPAQLVLASLPPYLHLSFSERGAPTFKLGESA